MNTYTLGQVGILVPFTLGFEKLYMGDKEQCLFIVDEATMLGALQVCLSCRSLLPL